MSSGSDKRPGTMAAGVKPPQTAEIDAGFRHWYNACSCCLSDHFPDIKATLDAEGNESGPSDGTFVKVGSKSEIRPGEAKQVETSGPTLAVFNASGTFYAIDDRCPHMGCPLSEGDLEGTILTCSCHGSRFNLTTGALVRGPATKGVRTHQIRVTADDIEAEL